jgi:hypothetical protein
VQAKDKVYATLSYFWGFKEPSERLTKDGNALRKLPQSLPMTIQDAIAIIGELRIWCLWIDRYFSNSCPDNTMK